MRHACDTWHEQNVDSQICPISIKIDFSSLTLLGENPLWDASKQAASRPSATDLLAS